jgi:hypothetical protein
MAYASQAGRARTSSKNPQAHAICDRCGFRYNFVNLQWQFDWRGASLQNLRVLVCTPCLDTPQEQLRAIVVPADPTPIIQARPENFQLDETDNQTISAPTVYDPVTGIPIPSTTNLVTQDGNNLTTEPYGQPVGLEQYAISPLNGTTHYGSQVPVLSVTSNGSTTIAVTCSSPHGLTTNSQISVEGLSNNLANGFYSVVVTTATAFTYQTYSAIPSASLLTSTSNIVTALVGLPYGYTTIPQIGP